MAFSLSETLLSIICPKFCVGCGWLTTYLCPTCYEQIEFYGYQLPVTTNQSTLDQLWVGGCYQSPLGKLIRECKYHSVKGIAQFIADLLYYTSGFPVVELLTWVPIHPTKERQRGFNQSELIATQLSKHLQIPAYPLLLKSQVTPAQASLASKQQRLHNLHDSFSLHETYRDLIQSQSIMIIDDVTTTGATFTECATVLKAAGAAQVIGYAAAHEL